MTSEEFVHRHQSQEKVRHYASERLVSIATVVRNSGSGCSMQCLLTLGPVQYVKETGPLYRNLLPVLHIRIAFEAQDAAFERCFRLSYT